MRCHEEKPVTDTDESSHQVLSSQVWSGWTADTTMRTLHPALLLRRLQPLHACAAPRSLESRLQVTVQK